MVSACPHCGKKLKANEALAGKLAICPACKQRFTIAGAGPETGKMQQAERPSSREDQAAAPVSSLQTNTDAPGSDLEPPSKSDTTSKKSQADEAPPPAPAKAAAKSNRRRLFAAVALTAVVACAIIVAGSLHFYPESQGPLAVYVVPHVDDIDGSIDKSWFFFFDQLRQWHERNSIPACFAFYPSTMNDEQFNRIIADMHASEKVELVFKGEDQYQGKPLDQMSSVEVQRALQAWKNKFTSELQKLGLSDVQPPVAYNQLMMGLTEAIRDAAREAQFKICLELGSSESGYINMLPDFDITQYSVSLTRSGEAGPDEEFKTPEEMIQELSDFQGDYLIYIDGIKVVPLRCSQKDFRLAEDSPALDEEKWKAYTSLLRKMKKDTRISLLTARDVYKLRHGVESP